MKNDKEKPEKAMSEKEQDELWNKLEKSDFIKPMAYHPKASLSNETKVVESVEQAVNIYFSNLISAQEVMDMYPDMAFLEGAKFGVNWQFKNTDAVKVIEQYKAELKKEFEQSDNPFKPDYYNSKIATINHILKLIQQ